MTSGLTSTARHVEKSSAPLASRFTAQVGIFTTHDVFVAAYLHGRGVKTDFCKENWPRFLDAAAIIESPSGARRYALLRSGLSSGVCGVAPGEKPC